MAAKYFLVCVGEYCLAIEIVRLPPFERVIRNFLHHLDHALILDGLFLQQSKAAVLVGLPQQKDGALDIRPVFLYCVPPQLPGAFAKPCLMQEILCLFSVVIVQPVPQSAVKVGFSAGSGIGQIEFVFTARVG